MMANPVTYEIIVRGNNLAFRGGYFGLANIVLVFTPDGPLLFDTGHYSNRPLLLDGLARHGLAPGDIRTVFLSHLHFDHCNNIDLFPEAKVYLSRREWEYAKSPHENDTFVPWLIHEQLEKHDLVLIDGAGEISAGVRYFSAPGHTPGCYALDLDTVDPADADKRSRVVLASDAVKNSKEAVSGICDLAFDDIESGTATIRHILSIADRIVPGHFPELTVTKHGVTWDDPSELSLLVR